MENESDYSIKVLRSNNGGEFTSRELNQPQQNVVSERMNRTLANKAKVMMHAKGLPLSYWAKAFHTTTYVANRSPTTLVTNITP